MDTIHLPGYAVGPFLVTNSDDAPALGNIIIRIHRGSRRGTFSAEEAHSRNHANIGRVFRVGHILCGARSAAPRVRERRRAAARSAARGGGKQPRVVRANIEPVILALSSLSCTKMYWLYCDPALGIGIINRGSCAALRQHCAGEAQS